MDDDGAVITDSRVAKAVGLGPQLPIRRSPESGGRLSSLAGR